MGGAFDAKQWLETKRWDEIDGRTAEDESPFYYFIPAACAYYLGGYLLLMAEVLDNAELAPGCTIHFSYFLRGPEFDEMIHFLTGEQRTLLFRFLGAMLQSRDAFRLDEEDAAALRRAASLL